MRLLLVPALERPADPQGDSSVYWFLDLAEQASRRGWFTHFVLPKPVDVSAIERVNYLRYAPPKVASRAALSLMLPGLLEQWVHRDHHALMVDAVITNDAAAGAVIASYLHQVFRAVAPDVHVLAASVVYPGADEYAQEDQASLTMQALGATAGYLVAPSAFAHDRVLESVRIMLGPWAYAEAERRTLTLMAGPNVESIAELQEAKFPKRTLYFGGRFTATKGGEQAVKQYVEYAMTGAELDIVVTLVGSGSRLHDALRRYGATGVVQVHTGLRVREAWKLMSRCHVSMFYQTLRMLPSTPYEQMYAGLAVLFKNHGFERAMLPPDYPYLFETDLEGAAMLRWVCEHWEESVASLPAWQEWIQENVSRSLAFGRLLDRVVVVAEQSRMRRPVRYETDTHKVLRQAMEACDGQARWPDVIAGFKRLKPGILMENSQTRGILPLALYRWFMPPGWNDTCEEPEPVFTQVSHADAG